MAKSQFSLRRKQALRGKSSPVTKKTPNKGLMPVTKPRPCCLPPGRAYVPSKEGTLGRGVPWACAGSVPRWDPWSPSTLYRQALAQELFGLVGSGQPGLRCCALHSGPWRGCQTGTCGLFRTSLHAYTATLSWQRWEGDERAAGRQP